MITNHLREKQPINVSVSFPNISIPIKNIIINKLLIIMTTNLQFTVYYNLHLLEFGGLTVRANDVSRMTNRK